MRNLDFENKFCQALVEEILYLRDRNPEKDWWHIWWLTTVFSYCRWNKNTYTLPFPKELFGIRNDFIASNFEFLENEFADRELYFLKKYNIFSLSNLSKIDAEDRDIYPKITIIIDWYNNNYIRSFLWNVENDSLLLFLFWISIDQAEAYNYYFSFCESIDAHWIKALLGSIKLDPNYLFSNIAIAWYLFHQWEMKYAEKYYIRALELDMDNPWILWKYGMLLCASRDEKKRALAQSIMKKVISLLPTSPWVYDWWAEVFIKNCNYTEALELLGTYSSITEWKYRTYEPFMKFAEIYVALGDLNSARMSLEKEKIYYFGQGSLQRNLEVKEKINLLDSKLK